MTSTQPFMESAYNSSNSSATPSEQASQNLLDNAKSLNRINNLLNGSQSGGRTKRSRKQKRSRQIQNGGGRTIDVPLPTEPFTMPGPSYNNAWYVGEPCVGSHCGVPITPFVSEYIHNALDSSTPGANVQYPVIDRLGNSLGENFVGVQPYVGTDLNPGPFQINCVGGGRSRRSKKNKQSRNRRNRKNW
jgi:hypothetical protein